MGSASLCLSQAGKSPGGEPDGRRGEGEPRAENEGRDRRGQKGGSPSPRPPRRRRVRAEPSQVRGGGAGAGTDLLTHLNENVDPVSVLRTGVTPDLLPAGTKGSEASGEGDAVGALRAGSAAEVAAAHARGGGSILQYQEAERRVPAVRR